MRVPTNITHNYYLLLFLVDNATEACPDRQRNFKWGKHYKADPGRAQKVLDDFILTS